MYYKNRLLAFFDILGFANLLYTKDLEELHDLYKTFLQEVKSEIFMTQSTLEGSQNSEVSNFEKYIVFSDSIILVSYNIDDINNINKFILSCISLMEKSIKYKLPLRGAIGNGDIIIDEVNDIFLSKDFAKIYKFEGQQDWCGCSILDDTKKLVNNAIFGLTGETNKQSSPIIKYMVPLKSKSNCFNFLYTFLPFINKKYYKELMCLNFYYMTTNKEHKELLHYLNGDKKKKRNTELFFSYINTLDDNSQKLDIEFLPAVRYKFFMTETMCKPYFEDKNENNKIFPKTKFRMEFFNYTKTSKLVLIKD